MKVGFGQASITPRGGKTVIAGGIPVRYTDVVHDEVQAVAMVIEQNGERSIWVGCDMCHPTKRLTNDVIAMLKECLADFNEDELILSATHSTACFYLTDDEFLNSAFDVDYTQIMPLNEARTQVCRGIVTAVCEAVRNTVECTVEFSTADILTGFCRRVVYKDGSAAMYGDVYRDDFLRMEYPDGTGTQILYFYTKNSHKLHGIFAAVPCPAQADEGSVYITADYWGVVRERIANELGSNVKVLGVCRAAGELSPRRMLNLNGDIGVLEVGSDVAIRLGTHIADAIIKEKNRPRRIFDKNETVLRKITTEIDFPIRFPTLEDIENATRYFADASNFDEKGNSVNWIDNAIYKHTLKLKDTEYKYYSGRINLLRVGEILFFTAPVELFAEYANRIRAAFPTHPVIDVQLTNDSLGYLPTAEAIRHGGYSTMIFSTTTTPEGGQMFVEETIKLLKKLI